MTINSLVDICVRSGDLDRAYNLLKNPTLYTPPAGGEGWPGDVGEAQVEVGAADRVDSWRGEGSGGGGYEVEDAPAEGGGGRVAAAGARATGGYAEGGREAWGGLRLMRPSVEAFTSVLTGFAGVGDKDRALAVFQQVRR